MGGADVNVIVLPLTVNALLGVWGTFETYTSTWATDATGRDSVKAVVDPLPLKKSMAGVKPCVTTVLPIYMPCTYQVICRQERITSADVAALDTTVTASPVLMTNLPSAPNKAREPPTGTVAPLTT